MDEPTTPSTDANRPDYAALVRGLLDDLAGTSITALDLTHETLHISLRRVPGAQAGVVGAPLVSPDVVEARPDDWRAVVAPLTGLFYARPSPDEPPYVELGVHIEPDHVIGLIESMKMFNEVTADIAGVVHEIAAENGALIEAGQPIIYVEPGEDAADGPLATA